MSSSIDFPHIFALLSCYFLPYLHRILYTKKFYFHIYILNLHTSQILLMYFFPFKYPMNEDTLNFSGIITYICIWSGHTSTLIASTSFLLNFDANTIWYLHSHVMCDRLSVYGLFIRPTPLIFNILKPSNFKYYIMFEWNFCYSVQNFKFFDSPSIAGGSLLKLFKSQLVVLLKCRQIDIKICINMTLVAIFLLIKKQCL